MGRKQKRTFVVQQSFSCGPTIFSRRPIFFFCAFSFLFSLDRPRKPCQLILTSSRIFKSVEIYLLANITLLSNGLQPCRPFCATAELLKIGINSSRLVSNWKLSKNGHKFRRRQLLSKCVIPDLNETGPTSASRQKNALRITPRTCVRGCLNQNPF